ncbi:MAG: cysteine hydrolase family protein [Gammaproteobacteria bacterium]
MTQTALIIIDIQNDYFPGGNMPLHEPDAALERAAKILDHFRARDLPRFHIRHASVRPGASFMVPGTRGQEIHPRLAPREGEPVITKHFPSAFQETTLPEELRNLGAENLVVCGMMTHMCIDTSVRSAFERGYRVQLIADATATRALQFAGREVPAEQVQNAFLASLNGIFAQVLSADEWLEQAGE